MHLPVLNCGNRFIMASRVHRIKSRENIHKQKYILHININEMHYKDLCVLITRARVCVCVCAHVTRSNHASESSGIILWWMSLDGR